MEKQATPSADHRRSFEQQKLLLDLRLSLCYGLLGVVAIFSQRLFKNFSLRANCSLPIHTLLLSVTLGVAFIDI
ncbi:hypothetical protein [Nostoc sp. WHI]|uniref:hypothetical protein n=1 Tax=Nostoc sp. WHI TaxID=2650611 RepID=UPI0018C59027|nr:hypothetical protein [Nostoc sp. WHI]MBG1265142.1 hypothetical protein [Nostoc sp. WHI]